MPQTGAPHDIVCFGEVLWDLLPSGEKPGGAPMNVAYHLKQMGHHPAMISRVGEDDYGRRLLPILEAAGLSTGYVQRDAAQSTGLVHARANEHHEMAYDIAFPAAWDFIAPDDRFSSLLSGSRYFVFGSLAARNNVSRSTLMELLRHAPEKVLDINLRPPHFSPELVEELLQLADTVKMNEAELELIGSWYGAPSGWKEGMELLQDRFGIRTMVVTRGGAGAVLSQNGEWFTHEGYKVKVADTVGSGDSFLAGLLHQLSGGTGGAAALEFACAVGALVASCHGACPAYSLSELEEVRSGARA